MSVAADRRRGRLSPHLSGAADRHAGAARRHRHLRQPARASSGSRRSAARSSATTRRRSTRRPWRASPARSRRSSHQGISREHPLLSATLPDGARVQVVAPPATRGPLALAIRKHVSPDLTLDDYVAAGAFAETQGPRWAGPCRRSIDALSAQLDAGDIAGMLAAAVKARKNILVSGGTSTGKTTFLNALIREIPAERAADPDRGHARAVRRATRMSSACSPRAARSARPRSAPTTCSPRRCGCGPTGSSSASCAGPRPSPSCARSTPAIPDR